MLLKQRVQKLNKEDCFLNFRNLVDYDQNEVT